MKNQFGIILAAIIVVFLIGGAVFFMRGAVSGEERAMNLTEFGVAITIPGTLDDLTYVDQPQDGVGHVLHMSIQESCELGAFYTIQKNAISKSKTTWTKEKLESFQAEQAGNPAQVKQFTDFYLVFEPTDTECYANEKENLDVEKKRTALWNALVTARFM